MPTLKKRTKKKGGRFRSLWGEGFGDEGRENREISSPGFSLSFESPLFFVFSRDIDSDEYRSVAGRGFL